MSEILSVDIEGGDQVGKGDAVRNLSLELANEGLDVCVVSFPCYATPIGFAIRKVLKEDLLTQFEMDLKEAISAKMALFSLNRLEVLNSILSSKKNDIYLFDRGPFSNALTIAYALSTSLSSEYTEDLVEKALSLDSYFRKSMNVDDCVIRLYAKNSCWSKSRSEDGDLHESRDVQEISDSVYKIFGRVLGESWIDIASKDEKGWRERADIAMDCLAFIKTRFPLSKRGEYKAPSYFSIDKILDNLYIGSRIDESELVFFMGSVSTNNKQAMYEISESIAMQVVGSVREIRWYNREIAMAVRYILDSNPDILSLLEQLYGEGYVNKLVKSIE